jgi:hypothetical protein
MIEEHNNLIEEQNFFDKDSNSNFFWFHIQVLIVFFKVLLLFSNWKFVQSILLSFLMGIENFYHL